MRGRKPKPTSLKLSEGDPGHIGVRKLRESLEAQPLATRGLPECPRHLKGAARRVWRFLAEELRDMGLDYRCDALGLEGLSVMYARAIEADEVVRRDGLTIEVSVMDPEGKVIRKETKPNPAISLSKEAWKLVRSFATEFGLSPVARTRVKVTPPNDDDDLEKLLNAPRAPREKLQ